MSETEESSEGDKWKKEVFAPISNELGSDDDLLSAWSSRIVRRSDEAKKRPLLAEGLFSLGTDDVCGENIAMSDSNVAIHPYYNYPPVVDPGIMKALASPEKPKIYSYDGQDLYLALCAEMNACPVRLFHRGLLTAEINLSYYGVNPNGVRPMAMALQYNKTVLRLDLTDNFLNNDACYHLARMLRTNSTLKELILSGCRIGDSGLLRLVSTLSVNRSLVTLDISKNCLGDDSGVYLAKKIFEGAETTRVSLSKNNLGRDTAFALADAFECRNKLTYLDLSWNNFFHVPSMVKILGELSDSTVLQELNLSWNAMEGERVAGALKDVFRVPSLKVLNISNNRFQGEALMIIVETLGKAKKLVTLDLSYNPLSTKDAYNILEKMLRPAVKLENLKLDGITVEKNFLTLLEKVKMMKSRKKFSVNYGRVLHNWTIAGPDARRLIMERMDYLGKCDKRQRLDVALFFLRLGKEFKKPIPVQTLIDLKDLEKAPLDDDLIIRLAEIFPGPTSAKSTTINLQTICEYINRIWPDRKLPPTPPPQPLPEEPVLEAPPSPTPLSKKKGKQN